MPEELAWLDSQGIPYAVLGTPATTAQVHPARFTQTLLDAALERGAQLRIGCVDGLEVSQGQVRGVRVDGQLLPTDTVVIAMGPWSGRAAAWLPLPPVWGLKGHSITLQPTAAIPAQALFVDYVTATGERLAPEVYPRPDGEVYLCGLSEEVALLRVLSWYSHVPRQVLSSNRLPGSCHRPWPVLVPQRVQACYRPVTEDGLPFPGPGARRHRSLHRHRP